MLNYPTKSRIYFEELDMSGNAEREIPNEFLVPVEPTQDDQAKVIFGEDEGVCGVIVSSDMGELVLRTKEGTVKLNPARNLCKIN